MSIDLNIFKEGIQTVHEKVLNITNHQGNASQINNQMSPHIC